MKHPRHAPRSSLGPFLDGHGECCPTASCSRFYYWLNDGLHVTMDAYEPTDSEQHARHRNSLTTCCGRCHCGHATSVKATRNFCGFQKVAGAM